MKKKIGNWFRAIGYSGFYCRVSFALLSAPCLSRMRRPRSLIWMSRGLIR